MLLQVIVNYVAVTESAESVLGAMIIFTVCETEVVNGESVGITLLLYINWMWECYITQVCPSVNEWNLFFFRLSALVTGNNKYKSKLKLANFWLCVHTDLPDALRGTENKNFNY